MKVFYSQLLEDLYVYNNFINKKNNTGYFVELGGYDGVTYSNTKFFEDQLSFSGTLIEPTTHFNVMSLRRPNCKCHNKAVYYNHQKVNFLGDNAMSGIIENMDPKHIDHIKNYSTNNLIDAVPFKEILYTDNIKYIDILSIDVEGAEHAILETMDWSIPVYVIIIELDENNKEKDELCKNILRERGFEFNKKIHISEFWINKNYFRINELYDPSIPKVKLEDLNSTDNNDKVILPYAERYILNKLLKDVFE